MKEFDAPAASPPIPRATRRQFLRTTGAAAAGAAALPFFHFRLSPARAGQSGGGAAPRLSSWEDLYRERWTWDRVVKGSHGWANCRSACAWDIYVKDGVVVREEQSAPYSASEPGIPDFNPRGCQKGACYTEVMYGPSRLMVPLKRVGPRGAGRWQRIEWEQAISEIAEKMVEIAERHGPDTIYQDLGPNFDQGATTVGRFKFQMKAGGLFADNWAEIGDLNLGGALTLGFAHVGGSSDEWFLSDHLVVWMMNPSVTQMSDAHFLYEARYAGAELTVIDPHYTATAVHADQWLPLRTGTDAALGLGVAHYIWESGNLDEAYVREQTDFPLLVRLDTGRFLRGLDLEGEAAVDRGQSELLYLWNPQLQAPVPAPGSPGADSGRLVVEGFEPPIEGLFQVTLASGESVAVSPVGSLLREQLAPWTIAETARVTGLGAAQIEHFARTFAESKRPMILSSWGSNRFMHSDLMNRSKLLCLAMKGAIGKRGAGYQATGFIDLAGFGSSLQTSRTGMLGRLELMYGVVSPGELMEILVDLARGRKDSADVLHEVALAGEQELCATNVSDIDYHHQGIAERLNREVAGLYPRPLDAYVREAEEKGWKRTLPRSGPPRIFITGGSNLLRRSNQTQAMLDEMWPKVELVLAIDQKMNFTVANADYVLPAAGWYEKPGIKYAMSYIPYLHYCDAAVEPLAESKDEWEIYWLLTKRIEEIARERGTPAFDGCGSEPVDWKELHQQYSCRGAYGPKDAERVTQAVIDASPSAAGIQIADLKRTGVEKFKNTGLDIAPTHQHNPDWKGEGVLSPFTRMTQHKWHWPTQSGRQQFYLDHPWFIESSEALPTHKESPKAGGDHPFQLVSCHSRWSIHSTWRDTPMLLRLQRGEPVVYLNEPEALRLGLADNSWAELSNDLGRMRMRVKHTTMVRPGVAYYFHAWDPMQFPEHKSFKWLIPGLMKPIHMAGGQGHLRFGINHLQSGSFVQDTRVAIRPWQGPETDGQTAG